MQRPPPPGRARQRHHERGTTLIEALVAFLVLSLGLLALARTQSQLRLNADFARQQSEAVRIAQQEMESLRAFATTDGAGPRSFEAVVSASRHIAAGSAYELVRDVAPAGAPHAKTASISVRWTDRQGASHNFVLHSIITGIDPGLSGAWALGPH